MKRLQKTVLVLIGLAMTGSLGCSLCCSPYNDDYVTYGSRTPRIDRKHGRVGSLFSDSQAMGSEIAVQNITEGQEVVYDEEAEPVSQGRSVSLGTHQ